MDEFDLIREILTPLSPNGAPAFGLTDDAAVWQAPPGVETVLTKDVMVEGVHFPAGELPDRIAAKLLRVNLSDLAAMGADPAGYLLGLTLPRETDARWLKSFAAGLRRDQHRYGCALWGGDTTATEGAAVFSLTAIGTVPEGKALRRKGAGRRDQVYVTGTIGDAALGLKALQGEIAPDATLIERYRFPVPRLSVGKALRGLATTAADISDGLIADLGHICAASGLGAVLSQADIPLSPAAAAMVTAKPALWQDILAGGDDYELVFTAAPERHAEILALSKDLGARISKVGTMAPDLGVKVVGVDGHPVHLAGTGYRHF